MKKLLDACSLLIVISLLGCHSHCATYDVGPGTVLKHSCDSTWRASTVLSVPSKEWNLGDVVAPLLSELRSLDVTKPEGKKRFDEITQQLEVLRTVSSCPVVLAENPPDAVRDLELALRNCISANADLGLSEKTQKVLQVYGYNVFLRDALYRLNEAMLINRQLTHGQYETMFNEIVEASWILGMSTECKDPSAIARVIRAAKGARSTLRQNPMNR